MLASMTNLAVLKDSDPLPPSEPAPALSAAGLVSAPKLREIAPSHGYSGGRYDSAKPNIGLLAGVIAFHIVAIAVLATMQFVHAQRDLPERLSTFTVAEAQPAPPPEPAEPVETPSPAAPAFAPETKINLAAPSPVVVSPVISPIAQPVALAAPTKAPATTPAKAPAPAPIVPPDFSAGQLNNPGPQFPYLSRKAREEGIVTLRVLVSAEGRALELLVDNTSGFPRLDEAALKTVRKWRFVPARRGGEAVEAWVLVPVTFTLD